ncbi:MAG: hypothetical protein K9M45_05960 [Kiritimatiellales bacterium]|nr:hypothetical protein [Kiritimatiellales bacterium]
MGKVFGTAGIIGGCTTAFPYISTNPFAALIAAIGLIFIITTLLDPNTISSTESWRKHSDYSLMRARWAALSVPAMVVVTHPLNVAGVIIAPYVLVASAVLAQILFLLWAIKIRSKLGIVLSAIGLAAFGSFFWVSAGTNIAAIALVVSAINIAAMSRHRGKGRHEEQWWEVLLNHPARILFTTFFALCAFGTVLLRIPAATKHGAIETVDAVFTAVSAVCVTGLIVLDTPHDFTQFGQFCILLLIQLGGLGIMSITTLALHAMGQRLSLRQERLMTSITDTNRENLIHALATILKFTFIVEGIGALSLTTMFLSTGDLLGQAVWRGVFTSVSAFCNAGFALQSDSLISYQTNPMVLHMVAVLIICGGMAPATSLIIPRWLAGRPIPLPARIALTTTVIMLTAGTFFILGFEWNGALAGLSMTDKIQNAWFQSATLRTAGFNSVDISRITSPTFMVMVAFMFIGGSPGGTAGGVKTTTIGVLAMTFWTSIANRNEITIQSRRIHARTIYRAVTVVASGIVIWFLTVLMLEVTQQIPSRYLIFEATSAIGTVGLSTGATPMLDEMGKVIIIIAMFIGRIGPATLFMLLSSEQPASDTRYPVTTISIT